MDGELRCEGPLESAPLEARLAAEIPRLRAFVGRVSGARAADVDDLVQESLARALRLAGSFERSRALWPWLKRTAFHVLLDHREREARAPRVLSPDLVERGAHDRDELANREEVARLLASLPSVEREVLVRFHQGAQSVTEIALVLELPEGTVKSHLHRARKRLAQENDHAD